MMKVISLVATSLKLISLASAAAYPSYDNGAVINLRVEGKTGTLYEKQYLFTTSKSSITTLSGGTHRCDGTNNGANAKGGPTCTGALVDAKILTFDGTYDSKFDDYLITKIGNDAQAGNEYWGVLRNYQFTSVGGCQQQVTNGDPILWAYDAFSKKGFLKLVVQQDQQNGIYAKGKQLSLLVTDGATGKPVSGANIVNWEYNLADGHGQAKNVLGKTDANGALTITSDVFDNHWLLNDVRLKADLTGYLRSNSVWVIVQRST